MSIPDHEAWDVIVVGAGSAGCSAAIAASRAGRRVLLIDRLPFLGGTSTAVLDTFYGFFTPGESDRKIVGGVGDDVVAGLGALGPVITRPNSFGAGTGITYHPDHLKVVWESLVMSAGVSVLLNAMLQSANVVDGRVTGVVVATRAGLVRFTADVFIEASGDADLCHFAGFGYETAGTSDPAQTLTTTFRMANVNHAARSNVTKAEITTLMNAAAESGDYDLPRREGSDHITPISGVTATIMTRLPSVAVDDSGTVTASAVDPVFLSGAEMRGRTQALEYVRFLQDFVPGYEAASMISFGTTIGVRESRRVYGDYRMTADDVLGARQFDDQVALCGAPIEDHAAGTDTRWEYLPDGQAVGIPLRSLVVRDAENVLVAGRCFSASHRAHASVRSMAQCMAMGQAVGEASALAVSHGGDIRAIDPGRLISALVEAGAVVSLDTV